jgi:hypothetical protein
MKLATSVFFSLNLRKIKLNLFLLRKTRGKDRDVAVITEVSSRGCGEVSQF